jgi:hypothetical protein
MFSIITIKLPRSKLRGIQEKLPLLFVPSPHAERGGAKPRVRRK